MRAWAGASGLVMSFPLAGALLDSRHFSSDGRLGYWTPARVRRALLEWICWGVRLSGSPAGPIWARSGNSPSFL